MTAFYTCHMPLRIKELREAKNWSQDVLAEKANISRSQLAQIESEARPANTLRLNAIAKALDVEVFELFVVSDQASELLQLTHKLKDAHYTTVLDLARSLAALNSEKDVEPKR